MLLLRETGGLDEEGGGGEVSGLAELDFNTEY